jgi:hypothetical protein
MGRKLIFLLIYLQYSINSSYYREKKNMVLFEEIAQQQNFYHGNWFDTFTYEGK